MAVGLAFSVGQRAMLWCLNPVCSQNDIDKSSGHIALTGI